MGATFVRRLDEGWVPPVPGPVVDAVEEVGAGQAHEVLCRLLARLVDSPAAGHVRYDAHTRTARLTLWRRESTPPTRIEQLETAPPRAHDWWTASRSRRLLLEWLDQRYLAELALATDPAAPSLIVVGRQHPFTDTDTERISEAHRLLRALERVVERAQSTRAAPRIARQATGSGQPRPLLVCELTAREQEVLEMLGEGLMARSIAQRLEVSERTVHKHLGNLYRKLDAHDRLLAVRRAEVLGLLPEP